MPQHSELFQFNLKSFVAFLLCAIVLVGSWAWCGSQCCTFHHDHSLRVAIWNKIDLSCFRFLNRWLLTQDRYRILARVFVVLNSAFVGEIICNLIIIGITSWIFSSRSIFPRQPRSFKVAVVLAMIFYGMAGQMLLSKFSRDYLCPNRPSPAVVFRFSTNHLEDQAIGSSFDSFTVNRLFEEAKRRDIVKETAYDSWPGEHAAVNFIWALFMSIIISRSPSLTIMKRILMHSTVWFFTIFFSSARLVSGAHWLSDCLAGGLSEALVVVAFGAYTPIFQICTKLIHRCFQVWKTKDETKLP